MIKNKSINVKRLLKIICRAWFGTGILAVTYSLTLTACSSIMNNDGSPRINEIPSHSVTDADMQRLALARRLWIEEHDEHGDPFTAGKAAYDIASLTHDVKWASEAVSKLKEARTQMPQFAQATAYLGSAYALKARDYPLQGLWQLLPGPGFVRIYYVKRAASLLDDAVEQDPRDPVSRLVRAATLINMPGFFVEHDLAIADFEILASWEEDPNSNTPYADILKSTEWRSSFYENFKDALIEQGETERAAIFQQKLLEQNEVIK